jgi:hypothetical protein
MLLRIGKAHDPWWDDGVNARRTHRRTRVVSGMAMALAIGACGLTLAVWVREIGPVAERLLAG